MRIEAIRLLVALVPSLIGANTSGGDGVVSYGPSYFRKLLDQEGPRGIEERLYVAPPDLMTPLLSGIASGTGEWLDIYDKFRRGLGAGSTRDYLDDSLARALGNATEGVLSYFRAHPEIPVAQICRRAAPWDGDPAEVLPAPELLGIVRRQKGLGKVDNFNLRAVKATCLAATSELVHRQLRIYLASHGAADSTSTTLASLSAPERQELALVIADARKDGTLRARRDGTFPDGPFRLNEIPLSVLRQCTQRAGRTANPEGPWEGTDAITDLRLPRVRLLNACRIDVDQWDLTCQQGGFAPSIRHVRVRGSENTWELVPEPPAIAGVRGHASLDPWPDCRSFARPAKPPNPALQDGASRRR